jgi:branched-chain amino acid transport system permease protein
MKSKNSFTLSEHKSKFFFLISIAAVIFISFFSSSIDTFYYRLIIYIGINIILASSLNLINGFTGQFSLGHAGFMAIGGYFSLAISTYYAPLFNSMFGTGEFGSAVSFIIILILSGSFAALAGLIVGVPSLRLKGDYLAITTLGFGEIIRVIIQGLNVIGASQGFSRVYAYPNGVKSTQLVESLSNLDPVVYSVPKYTNFLSTYVIVVIVIFIIFNLINSTFGRGFLAVKDDEIASESMGVNTTKFKVIAFVTGAFFAGIAGSLYGHFNTSLIPEEFNFLKSVEIVVMVIVGGMGSIIGSVIAAIILTLLPELLRGVQEYRMILYALILIIMMLTRPQGLFGLRINFKKAKKSG